MNNSINQAPEIKNEQDFINYLVGVALLKEDENRAVFYENTINMDEGAIFKLKETVEKIALESLKNASKDEREAARIQHRVERCLHSIFTPWYRLAGRMESAILAMDGILTESALASIGRRFSELPEYEQYLESSFKGFIFNRCVDYNLDYTQMPQELKQESLESRFLSDYPFNIEAKEWDMLGLAYEFGKERVITLQEEPSPINGYIGGETKMNRFLRLNFGPELKDGVINGRVTAVGQIDYKDCTNAFVIIDNNRAAVNIFSLKPRERRQVLEAVFYRCQFLKREESPSERRARLRNKAKAMEEKAANKQDARKTNDKTPKIK